jgi:quercetin 2,3-dioxygenase
MIKLRYQQIASSKIPVATSADGQVIAKVIAGEALGVQAAIETGTLIMYLHFTLSPKANLATYPTSIQFICLHRIREEHFGKNNKLAQRGQAVIFSKDGDLVSIKNPSEKKCSPLDVLLIAGIPLNEPVAHYRPFVMNKSEEIVQAIKDYRNGKMGRINF